jgi:hypothetical protein
VRRFIINGKTDEVRGLSKVLKQTDPAAWQEARAQLGDVLKRAGFGENPVGDAPFAPTRYMAALRRIGPDKLGAFFAPDEVAQLMTVGRVGSYIKQAPNASAPNTSNTASAAMNLLARVPGVSGAVGLANRAAGAIKDNATVRRSVAAEIPATRAPLSDVQRNYLAYLLALGTGGAGALAARGQ